MLQLISKVNVMDLTAGFSSWQEFLAHYMFPACLEWLWGIPISLALVTALLKCYGTLKCEYNQALPTRVKINNA
jgi:hypothetical protein